VDTTTTRNATIKYFRLDWTSVAAIQVVQVVRCTRAHHRHQIKI